MQQKSAIWIAIEYENLGGKAKFRKNLVKKTVTLNKKLKDQYKTCQFNIKKAMKLNDLNLLLESAEKIMELYPDPESYKHIKAKRIENRFKRQ